MIIKYLRTLANTAISVAALYALTGASAQDAVIRVQADRVVHPVSRLLTGACIEDVNHEIYGGLYSQMIFGESFQEPPPPKPLPGFATYGGRWTVGAGDLHADASDGGKLVSRRPVFKDGLVTVEMLFPESRGENAGLIVRVSGAANGADAFTGYEISLDPTRQTLRLARHRNNYELIEDAPCQVPVGRWFRLSVALTGSVIEISVDGKRVLSHDEAAMALGAGTVGLRTWKLGADFRNLLVKVNDRVEPLTFVEPGAAQDVSGMWRPVQRGSAKGSASLTAKQPFVGRQSQQMSFESGEGEIGIENQGLNRWGLNLVSGKPYEGCVWARSGRPTTFYVALESGDGSVVYAEKPVSVPAGTWRKLTFSLTPRAGDKTGRFALKLKRRGSVTFGYAFLQPGQWSRFKGLPVRRDVAGGLIAQGINVLRYGGSMVNSPEYRWKNMLGPRDRRPPYRGTWYPYSSNGWGIPDFLRFCEAAGVECIPDFNSYEKPQDMADFIEFANGPLESKWGRRRAAEGHPAPYKLKYIELGNEERVDERYADRFEALARAIWAKDSRIILVVGDFVYREHINDPFRFGGADSGITTLAAQQRILRLAKAHNREVWFDVHMGTEQPAPFNAELDGMLSFADALDKIADGAKHKVVVFEYNANNHAVKRALASALATFAIERDGRIPIVTSANGLQPDGQNDNGWDQGLLFMNSSRVWLQPPGYATQMLSRSYLPQLVQCEVTATGSRLDAVAQRSADGKTVVLQVVNPGNNPVAVQIDLSGMVPRKPIAHVTVLSGGLNAVNTADTPKAIVPQESTWTHRLKAGKAPHTFAPRSFTVIRFE